MLVIFTSLELTVTEDHKTMRYYSLCQLLRPNSKCHLRPLDNFTFICLKSDVGIDKPTENWKSTFGKNWWGCVIYKEYLENVNDRMKACSHAIDGYWSDAILNR